MKKKGTWLFAIAMAFVLVSFSLAYDSRIDYGYGSNKLFFQDYMTNSGGHSFCGDGMVNQFKEECDRKDGLRSGYFCSDDCKLVKIDKNYESCTQAILDGTLTGYVNDGFASVINKGKSDFLVSFVAYKMYAPLIDDQTYYDSGSFIIKQGGIKTMNIKVPTCGYQTELVCGLPIKNKAPYYGNKVIDFSFQNQDNYCTQTKYSNKRGISATISIAPYFPQDNNYVFFCSTDGFDAIKYIWYYGDSQILPNTPLNNTFHAYDQNGVYHVACFATDGINSATDVMDIIVTGN
jgi:hypothetical protein